MVEQKKEIIHKSEDSLAEHLKDYLSFGVKSHSIFTKILFRKFLSVKNIDERRVLRAKIFFEYFLTMEEFFAYAYALSQAHTKSEHQSFTEALFDYSNIQLNKFIGQNFERKNLDKIFGFPDEDDLANNLNTSTETVNSIYNSICGMLNNAREESSRGKRIFFKLKHCFLIKKKG
ncbi:hypothetical protein K8R42_04670, partial [bacterium]|nr:hypothetical protein [bacterium]